MLRSVGAVPVANFAVILFFLNGLAVRRRVVSAMVPFILMMIIIAAAVSIGVMFF